MTKEIITLRGGLGTQFMTLFHAYALNIQQGRVPPVDEIQINVVNAPVGSTTCWVTELFDVDIPCGVVPAEVAIKNMNPCLEGYSLGLKYQKKILDKHLKIRYNGTHKVVEKVLHVRGSDNQFISEDKYCEIAEYIKPTLIGDDKELIARIVKRTGADFLSQNAADDWHTTLDADVVYGGLSTFILSGNLIHPNRKIRVLAKDKYHGPKELTDSSYKLFSECLEILPNGKWL